MDRDLKLAEYVRDAVELHAEVVEKCLNRGHEAPVPLDLPSLIARFRAEHPEGGEAAVQEACARECERLARLKEEQADTSYRVGRHENCAEFTVRRDTYYAAAGCIRSLALARPSPHPEGDVRAALYRRAWEEDRPQCESCDEPAFRSDPEGVPLCDLHSKEKP